MIGQAEEKVKGGKLLKIKVDFDKRINSVHITGDFFLHPEDSVNEIEKLLVGMPLDEEEKGISDRIKFFVDTNEIKMIGIDEESIARVLKAAMR